MLPCFPVLLALPTDEDELLQEFRRQPRSCRGQRCRQRGARLQVRSASSAVAALVPAPVQVLAAPRAAPAAPLAPGCPVPGALAQSPRPPAARAARPGTHVGNTISQQVTGVEFPRASCARAITLTLAADQAAKWSKRTADKGLLFISY